MAESSPGQPRFQAVQPLRERTSRLPPAVSAPSPADTAQDVFARLKTALGLLHEGLKRNPVLAAAKSGPRSPSAGQVEALKAPVNRYGADLVAPLQTARQKINQLADADEAPGPA